MVIWICGISSPVLPSSLSFQLLAVEFPVPLLQLLSYTPAAHGESALKMHHASYHVGEVMCFSLLFCRKHCLPYVSTEPASLSQEIGQEI